MIAEEKIVEILLRRGLKVATAESCTGGMIASRLVNVPGVSSVFEEGYITYSDEAKQKLLGVQEETLKNYSAVSSQTAAEMAQGAVRAAGADCSVVTTGIAGPDGGSAKKPVGLVYIGTWVKGKVTVTECHFAGDRMEVRNSAAQRALEILLEQLEAEEK
ncbi:MAG: CinA family protein [Lachnospiraceae bacterium]|nr:CinA family protein [Lachnospiraceae bacterium]